MASEWVVDRPSIEVLAERQRQLRQDVDRLDEEKAEKAATVRIADDVSSLRKLIIGFLASFSIASAGFGFAMIELLAGHVK